ncbi:hypothetical protein OIO90_004366 [Microbotryomycetes sp. JL221]|nr:hypothetical protein OIO90_004366 [Microbotryomycetes sp. JL221]
MSSTRTFQIPSPLPVLALPPGQVLYPSLVLSVEIYSKQSISLLQTVLRDADQNSGNKALIIGCAPLKSTHVIDHHQPSNGDTNDHNNNDNDHLKVISLPKDNQSNRKQTKPSDLFEYATAARIVRLERHSSSSSGGFIIVLEGLTRLKLDQSNWSKSSWTSFLEHDKPQIIRSTPLQHDSSLLLQQLQHSITKLLTTLTSTTPISNLLNKRLKALVTNLNFETAPSLVDAVIASVPVSKLTGLTFEDKLSILATSEGTERCQLGLEIITKCDETLNLQKRIETKVDQNLNRKQREFVLLQQLQAIKQELQELSKQDKSKLSNSNTRKRLPNGEQDDDDEDDEDSATDDMVELEKAIKSKVWTPESKKVAMREFKRLKKSPPQGAEHGVIRNYLDWLLAIPWTESTPLPLSRDFIETARQKLNDDHYGLDKVKKRLLEWLAVLRLKQEQWEFDQVNASVTNQPTSSPVPSTELVLHESSGGPSPANASTTSPDSPVNPPSPVQTPTHSPTKPRDKGPILLLCGPPGTGKTSIARSLADSMGRKFYRISLGGVRDEAEIRGHRRTYVSALPGALSQALKQTGVNNPVILLDEIDKLGMSSTHGDPGAALLEVLDPEQNWCFKDHYLDIPLDLSSVLFIATANSLETISDPLYDRMEPIQLSGYTPDEKLHIAKKYLLPKQMKSNSLNKLDLVSMEDSVLLYVVTHYTHEAGVRSLEREIGSICRAKAVEFAQARDKARDSTSSSTTTTTTDQQNVSDLLSIEVDKFGYNRIVTQQDVENYLGIPKFDKEELEKENLIGVSTGLSYQGSGNGGILHIETTTMPGKGSFQLTGQLGDVIQESARLAFTWVKSHAFELGLTTNKNQDIFKEVDVHLHLPSGSIKKDGPSAGVAMVVAIVSLITPVGGIKEKILGAHRAGITTVLLPFKNRKDVEVDLNSQIKKEIEIVYIKTIWEALEQAFGSEVLWNGVKGGKDNAVVVESRL